MDQNEITDRLLILTEEHRDLDDAINALIDSDTSHDQLKIQRLKKRKLNLKDDIQRLKAMIVPDIIA